jgi:hypothetical protein
VTVRGDSPPSLRLIVALCFLVALYFPAVRAQETQQKPTEKRVEKTATPAAPEFPAQLSLLETRVRFEASGDSRKEVHTIVKINNELGVRQFARLNFDYNRAFEQIEIPFVRITHSSGGTTDILPSAITDNPNPAVVNAPAYQDVRVKSVRILGLAPGDTLEYRVITTISHPSFAPNFYLSHDFANDGLAAREVFEVSLPSSLGVSTSTSRAAQEFETEKFGEGANARLVYRWERPVPSRESSSVKQSSSPKEVMIDLPLFFESESDVAITSFPSWADVLIAMQKPFGSAKRRSDKLQAKAEELAGTSTTPEEKLHALYDFVTRRISTIDLPLGATGYMLRSPEEILSSGYAVPEDKCLLLAALALAAQIQAQPALTAPSSHSERGPALPSILTGALVVAYVNGKDVWLDTSAGITPFGMIAANLRGKPALLPFPRSDIRFFEDIPKDLPFAAWQRVNVDANIGADGKLTAKVKYALRGDNELILRVAFHQTPKEKWNDVAQLLSLSDGFRGKIISATASDPYATKEPFAVEYEIDQAKFVDWSKKPVRIPAILPLVALPDSPAKPASGAAASPIDLGTPLDVETKVTLQLPPGTSAHTPTGISVERDYATFASQYSAKGATITASRHINFLLREVPAARAADYNAFVRAVQNDQSQVFTLERPESAAPKTNSAPPVTAAPPKQQSPL